MVPSARTSSITSASAPAPAPVQTMAVWGSDMAAGVPRCAQKKQSLVEPTAGDGVSASGHGANFGRSTSR